VGLQVIAARHLQWGLGVWGVGEGAIAMFDRQTGRQLRACGPQANQERVLESLRDELAAAERRLGDERAAHAASRRAASERAHELEASLAEAAASLSAMQRAVEERAGRLEAAEARADGLLRDYEKIVVELGLAQEKLKYAPAPGAANPAALWVIVGAQSFKHPQEEPLTLGSKCAPCPGCTWLVPRRLASLRKRLLPCSPGLLG
jgi:hypothetical protein